MTHWGTGEGSLLELLLSSLYTVNVSCSRLFGCVIKEFIYLPTSNNTILQKVGPKSSEVRTNVWFMSLCRGDGVAAAHTLRRQ